MPFERINQTIDVLVAFRKDRPEPMVFKWGNHHYQVRKINTVHAERDGRERILYFSVSDEVNLFRLSFHADSMAWRLEERCLL
jgi:hypothetical protein